MLSNIPMMKARCTWLYVDETLGQLNLYFGLGDGRSGSHVDVNPVTVISSILSAL